MQNKSQTLSQESRCRGAIYGLFIGDALAMPVHWYYDTLALKRDYGRVTDYLSPRNPHPDSILWRSTYTPLNEKANILHEQAQYWESGHPLPSIPGGRREHPEPQALCPADRIPEHEPRLLVGRLPEALHCLHDDAG